MRVWKIATIAIAALVLLIAGFYCALIHPVVRAVYKVREKERLLASAAVVQTAGRDFAVLCQTALFHPEWFPDDAAVSPAWLPASILKMDPFWVNMDPELPRVEFHGGLHHSGYRLDLESKPTDADPNAVWALYLYAEGTPDLFLARFTLVPEDALSEDEFVVRTMAELDRRIAAGGTRYWSLAECRTQRQEFAAAHR